MLISIENHTNGKVKDEEMQKVIRAINRQIKEDYEPFWSITGQVRLEGMHGNPGGLRESSSMRGDAVIYIWDKVDVDDALGYHDKNDDGIPYGFIFIELVKQLGEKWSVTLSHEVLELLGDPEVNLFALGPHPRHPDRDVFHWCEMCDAVQNESYEIDGVEVSNFVLPLYFTPNNEPGARNDFLCRSYDGKTLQSFGVNPGGYIGYFDPHSARSYTFDGGNAHAQKRLAIKAQAQNTRRSIRYKKVGKKASTKKK